MSMRRVVQNTLRIGNIVNYYSSTAKRWVEAEIAGFTEAGLLYVEFEFGRQWYKKKVSLFSDRIIIPENLCFCLQIGDLVNYNCSTVNAWVEAEIVGFAEADFFYVEFGFEERWYRKKVSMYSPLIDIPETQRERERDP